MLTRNPEILIGGVLLLIIYLAVLRKHNSLGLRMLILCYMVAAFAFYWIYKDHVQMQAVKKSGKIFNAIVLAKHVNKENKNAVQVQWKADDGKEMTGEAAEYTSAEEYAAAEPGQTVPVIFASTNNKVYLQVSYNRFEKDYKYMYVFPFFFLLLGTVLWFWLRKKKVGVDEHGNEWVENEDGSIILDERKSKASRVIKRGNIISKVIQAFSK